MIIEVLRKVLSDSFNVSASRIWGPQTPLRVTNYLISNISPSQFMKGPKFVISAEGYFFILRPTSHVLRHLIAASFCVQLPEVLEQLRS